MADAELVENFDKLLNIASKGSTESVHSFLATTGLDINYMVDDDRTVLMLAVASDYVAGVKCLIDAGADVDRRNMNGVTVLMLAVANNYISAAKCLIDAGADVDRRNKNGLTALMLAARYGRVAFLNVLLKAGANKDLTDSEGKTVLMFAVIGRPQLQLIENIKDCVKFLINAGVDVNAQNMEGKTALMLAASYDHVECLKVLLKAGAHQGLTDSEGKTALMLAASYGHVKCLKVLLRAGANIDLTDSECKTVLMLAVIGRPHLELNESIKDCVKFLINAGVDVNAQNMEGKTALMFATESSWGKRCICDLISADADVNLLDKDGRTALMHAAASHSSSDINEIIEIPSNSRFEFEDVYEGLSVSPADGCVVPLIKAGSDINKRDNDGHTALMIACSTQHVWCVACLALSGANVNMRDPAGRTALMYSAMRDSLFMAVDKHSEDLHSPGYLVRKDADVNLQDNDGMSALMFAARSGFYLTAMALVNAGSDMEQKDKMGRTALIHALLQIKLIRTDPYLFNCLDRMYLTVSYFLREGASYVLSEEFLPLTNQIAGANLHNNNYNMYFLQFLICNGSTDFRHTYSPFTDVDTQAPGVFLPYLFANCCIFNEDLRFASETNLRQDDDNTTTSLMEEAFSNPWPLVKLAFIAVSSAIGHSPGRQHRVRQTNLELSIQDCLLFRRPISLLPVHHWKDIPLCFNPVEYEQLPAPYPLLYNWPFGRELVKCECEDCHGKGVNFHM